MQIVRFGDKGLERPGLFKEDRIIDLRKIFPDIPDIDATFFENGWMQRCETVDAAGEKMDVRIGPPVACPSKIMCLGKNYTEHAKEGGSDDPERPLLFCKSINTLNGPYDPVLLPVSSHQVDWEVELAVIIGKKGKRIAKADAFDYIAGFTVMNDVSGRDAQFADSQWYRGKTFDTFAPLGPALVTLDEIGGPVALADLNLTCTVNGVVMQNGNTADLIFDIPYLIENISEDITLMPGDVISTGTPSGVGIFRDPPIVLKAGDVVECSIEKIGAIKNQMVAQ
jgi:2,4-didehydro-3-deoxy-L-rhamnonate hydrolase